MLAAGNAAGIQAVVGEGSVFTAKSKRITICESAQRVFVARQQKEPSKLERQPVVAGIATWRQRARRLVAAGCWKRSVARQHTRGVRRSAGGEPRPVVAA